MPNSELNSEIIDRIAKTPITNHLDEVGWENLFVLQEKSFHRNQILKRGRVNFRSDFCYNGFTLKPNDIELIYRFYYFQFHYTSSFLVFKRGFDFLKNYFLKENTLIIDFGCGPFTSMLALKALCFANNLQPKFSTLNIDIAPCMLNSATKIAQYSNDRLFETNNFFGDNYKNIFDLHYLIDKNQLIINLCYFLSSYQLDIDDFINDLENLLEFIPDRKILFIYQNPDNSSLNQNWIKLKTKFQKFYENPSNQLSHAKKRGFSSLKNSNTAFDVNFTDITGSWAPRLQVSRPVYFDYFYNH